MGLPIWQNPDEQQNKNKKKGTARDALRGDPTAATRSPIRRSVLREREASRMRTYQNAFGQTTAGGVIGGRLPPVTTLLETVDRNASTRERASRWSNPRRLAQDEARLAFTEQSLRDMREATAAGFERVQASRNQNALNASGPESRRTMRSHIEANTNVRRPLEETSARGTALRAHSRPGLENDIDRFRGSDHPSLPTPPSGDDENDSDDHVDGPSIDPRSAVEGVLPALVRATGDGVRRMNHSTHPLSRSWRPSSPSAGRSSESSSPTSENTADAWEVMQSTITPDDTLPSADSSFTSTVVSNEFSTGGASTTVTTPATSFNDGDDTRHASDRAFIRSGSVPSPADILPSLVCDDEDESTDDMELATEALAEEMFRMESDSAQGRARIAHQQVQRDNDGYNRYAWPDESQQAEIGLRLINDAFGTTEGTARVVDAQNTLMSRDGVIGYLEHRRDPHAAVPLGNARPTSRGPSSVTATERLLHRQANRALFGPLNSHPLSQVRETANDSTPNHTTSNDSTSNMVYDGRRLSPQSAARVRAQSALPPLATPANNYNSDVPHGSDGTAARQATTTATMGNFSSDYNTSHHWRIMRAIVTLQEAGAAIPVELWSALAHANGNSNHSQNVALLSAALRRRAARTYTPAQLTDYGPGFATLPDALDLAQGSRNAVGVADDFINTLRRREGAAMGENHHQRRDAIRREDGTEPARGAISSNSGPLRLRGGA